MHSKREAFAAIYGALNKPIYVYDQSGTLLWQNAAADQADAAPASLVAREGAECLRLQQGCSVEQENKAYALIPHQMGQETYLVIQAERDYQVEQKAATCVLRNASAKLNGYLNRIYGTAQQIGLETPEGEQLGKEVQHILRMSNHLYQLLDRSGTKDYSVPLHLSSYLDQFARAVNEMKPEIKIDLKVEEENLYGQVMPENMELMLAALVSNAYRFGNGTVAIRARKQGAMVAVDVLDNGEGAEDAARLFEWGYRTADKKGALGLGFSLATALKLAKLQGGSIEYHRMEGNTCFRLLLQSVEIPAGTRMAEWLAEPMANSLSQLRIELSDIL